MQWFGMAGCPVRLSSIPGRSGIFEKWTELSPPFPRSPRTRSTNYEVDRMAKLRLKYVVTDLDRHGKVRRYFRQKGKPKILLPGLPGSAAFMTAYQQALEGKVECQRRPLRM